MSNVFTNSINGTTTINVVDLGAHRLDKQRIDLPVAFLTQTLTQVIFSDTGGGSFQRIFVSGVTAETAAVPEPASAAMMAMGVAAAALGLRRRAARRPS